MDDPLSGRAFAAAPRPRALAAAVTVAAVALGLAPAAAAAPAPASPGSAVSPAPAPASAVPDGALELSRTERPVAPGAQLTTYESLEPGGWLAAQALTLDLTSDLEIDYLAGEDVTGSGTVSDLAAAHDPGEGRTTVAALNGDFYDINATGAPVGSGISGGELTQSAAEGSSEAVGIGPGDAGRVLELYFDGTLTLPDGTQAPLAAYNAARVPDDGVGVYTPQWGDADRALTVPGATAVTEVTLADGEVTAVSDEPGEGRIPSGSTVLLGRGEGADILGALTAGDTVDIAYAPRTGDGGPLPRTAVSGRGVLVEDGEPVNCEGQPNNAAAPRTAVGFSRDGQEMYVLTVDGRQARSAGVTLTGLAGMMADLGAYSALNLDGGGSTTLLARAPGGSAPEVVNSPSDGRERPVPNGLAVTAPEGSGRLTGFTVATAASPAAAPTADTVPGGHPERVFPGLTRQLTATGYDETYGPAEGDPRWSTGSRRVGTVSQEGVFTARRPGSTEVTAAEGDARGSMELTVLGELARVEPTKRRVGLADATDRAAFGLVGYDAAGNSAPIEPSDVALSYDTSVITVEPDSRSGGFTVTAAPGQVSGAATVTATVGGTVTELVVTIGLHDVLTADFEDAADWSFSHARAGGSLAPEPAGRQGTGLRLTYDFSQDTATRAAYATAPQDIPVAGQPQSFSLWIYGDGHGAWPSLEVTDAQGTSHVLRGDYLTWEGWRNVTFAVPEGVAYPLSVHRFYVAETRPDQQYEGEIVIDELTARTPPEAELPAAGADAGAGVIGPGTEAADRDWRFAVVSDAQFVAREPDSETVAQARRTLREARASDPEFVVINGDWVDEGSPADLAFARRVIEEELGDTPWVYVPGNHEVMGGSLEQFEAEFGDARLAFDHRGIRFLTLDTSSLTLRGAGYDQVAQLREQLDDAAADPTVGAVVVIGHVPPRDTTAHPASQLTDRREAMLLESWLADFRRQTGKGVVYLGAHVGVFDSYHLEGVPYVIGGNAGKAPSAAPGDGGFTGWFVVGVDRVTPGEQARARRAPHEALPDWVTVQTMPHVDGLTLQAPAALRRGETAEVQATVIQGQGQQAREVPVAFPVSADWSGSRDLFLGPAERATGRHVAAFDPATGELTGLRPGTVRLTVGVSGERQAVSVTVRR